MLTFAFTNLVAPINSVVIATLKSPDGSVVTTLTLTATSSGSTTYSGSVTLNPTPPDSPQVPYTFGVVATTTAGTTVIWPDGTTYGYLFDGEWQEEPQESITIPTPSDNAPPLEKWSVTVPPSSDPVSYATVKAALKLDNDAEQTLIQMYIDAATDYAQDALETSLMPQLITAVFNAEDVELSPPVRDYPWDPLAPLGTPLGTPSFATWGTYNRSPVIKLPRGPVQSINSITDASGANIANYVLERTAIGDRVRFQGTATYPVTVVYTAGYSSASEIPSAILVAILAHVGTLYANRASANGNNIKAVPHSMDAFYKLKARRIPCG